MKSSSGVDWGGEADNRLPDDPIRCMSTPGTREGHVRRVVPGAPDRPETDAFNHPAMLAVFIWMRYASRAYCSVDWSIRGHEGPIVFEGEVMNEGAEAVVMAAEDESAERRTASTSLGQVIKFALVGGINTCIDLVVLNLLIFAVPAGRSGWLYSLFKGIAFLFAVTNSYLLNRKFTFESKEIPSVHQMSRYLMVSIIGLIINVSVASAVVNFIPSPAFLTAYWPSVAALTGVPFGMLWNFVGYRFLVFD